MSALKRVSVRIEDVAKAAGVSTQTVSRVVNGRPGVAEATRQRVLEAIYKLGYEPNLFARWLAGGSSSIIGMIAEDLSEPVMASLIASVELEVKKRGYFLLVSSNINPSFDQPVYAQILSAEHLAGLIFSRLGADRYDEIYVEDLLTRKIPIVALGDWPGSSRFSSVGLSEVDGGYQATRYLLDLGHRRIGMITGPSHNSAARGRARGYEQALAEYGVTVDPELILEGDWTFHSGFAAAQKLIAKRPDISAIFCQNDRMAIGVLRALRQSGIKVPENVSVIGFDDIPDAAYSDPPLTTLHQSADEIGREAVRLLFDAIENPHMLPRRVEVRASLIQRESCRRYMPLS